METIEEHVFLEIIINITMGSLLKTKIVYLKKQEKCDIF